MAKYLFAPVPFSGHVNPGLPIAAELVHRGHSVRWHTTERFKPAVEKIGAKYVPFHQAKQLDEERLDEQFPERAKLKGIRQLKHDLHQVFLDQLPALLADLTEEIAADRPDVLVGDSVSGVCGMAHQRYGLKWAAYGITVLTQPSRDTAPFGLGLMPKASGLGRARNAVLNKMVESVIFRDVFQHYRQLQRDLGFETSPLGMFEFTRAADVQLQSACPSFEYPRSDLSPNIRFIGAFPSPTPSDWAKPDWWDEIGSRKVVLVTQGTIATDYDDLIKPAIRALASQDVDVIVTTGSKPPSALAMESLPSNVRVAQFIPYGHLMPKVDLLLTNGGYGSVLIALSHGVPMVVFGASEDKAEIANRVRWSGVGEGLKIRRPNEQTITSAVRKVLGDSNFKKRAEELQAELAQYDAVKLCGDYLEALAAS